tara:strand:- start:123 stop:428 length:306 start_codon:yes stop_codon:yes gene_type:complete
MKIFVDIDETICSNDRKRNYSNAKPIYENIKKVNALYDKGNEITYWSARGSGTGIDWYEVTKNQFKKWGVRYHFLILGEKPIYDLLIDDKALNILDIDRIL